jgi:hypothetical protein
MAYNNNYFNQQNMQQGISQFQNHLFPQPNGNVYTINSSSELSNIPVGMGLTVVLCMNEGLLYLKTIQNGNPVVWSYKLHTNEETPLQSAAAPNAAPQEDDKYKQIESRLAKLEKHWEDFFDERFKS